MLVEAVENVVGLERTSQELTDVNTALIVNARSEIASDSILHGDIAKLNPIN